nr:PREDICTED: chromosome transmission fidelity protein 18 homolog [Struthio camelus australis]
MCFSPRRVSFCKLWSLSRPPPSPRTASQPAEQDPIEKQIGKAVGKSDVWFRFNEGVSNAVRRNIYIKDLL